MGNGLEKEALYKFTTTPHLKPISDMDVAFYNLDENTALLRFQISNGPSPLSVSEENLVAYAYFESSNGSVSDVIEVNVEDHLNGIFSLVLDTEFLQASTSTTVVGQLYVGVNNVDGDPALNQVAVFREFSFEVADALINKISSFTKIEYIRMFSQLRDRIVAQVQAIEDAIANGADYVAEMKSVRQEGIETLNAIVTNGKTDIQSYIAQAKAELTTTKDAATADINTTANNAKTSVQSTANGAIESINTKSTETTNYVDAKVTEFNEAIESNSFITPEQLNSNLDTLEWQKYKLTGNDGTIKYINKGTITDIKTLPPGLYETVSDDDASVQGIPVNNTYVQIKVWKANNGRKEIELTSTYNGRKFFRLFHTDGNRDTGWIEVGNSQSDTGWIAFNLINGALSNTAYKSPGDNGFNCAYRIIVNGSVTTRKLRINGTNLTPGQTLVNLPSSFCKNAQTFPVRIPTKYSGGYIVIRPSGEVKFFINGDDTAWVSTDYAYGEMSWSD